jgi:hypothetical protein
MAYIFPVNPFDGQLYPVPAVPGALQYQWNASLQVWLIYSPLGVVSVSGVLPIFVQGDTSSPIISINAATINTPGSMSAADKAKLDGIPANAGTGTVQRVASGPGLVGGPITGSGTLSVRPATSTEIGGVIVGPNISVDANGVISVSTASLGVQSINVGPGLIGAPNPITNVGTISAALANRLSPGVVRVGSGLNIAPDGTISLGGSLLNVSVLAWGSVGVATGNVFTLKEGYNVSAVTYVAGDQPRVKVFFQNPLSDENYGVSLSARVSSFGSSSSKNQNNALINFSFKTTTYIDLLSVIFKTTDNTTNTMTTLWNGWAGEITEFDFILVDTAIY